MRLYPVLLLAIFLLITAGCVEPEITNTTVTTAPVTTTIAATNTPAPAPTLPPAEMAYISGIKCGVGDRSEAAYHCNGNVRIRAGGAHAVQVIARYPDNNTFYSGTVDLGGQNPIMMPFVVFPDIRYQGQEPAYSVKVDGVAYPVVWSGGMGVAWANR